MVSRRRFDLPGLLTLSGPAGILGAVLLYGLLLALLYPEAVFQGKIFISPDSLAPSGLGEYVKSQGLKQVLWNPFIFGGMPAFASLSYNPGLYPVTMLLRFGIDHLSLPPLSWLLSHYLWAGLGIFLFLRGRGVRGWFAWLAGALFLLMPTQVAIGAHGHGSKVMTLSWIPWLFLFTDRLVAGRRPLLYTGLLALALAGLLLTAHIQIVFYALLATALFALARLLRLAQVRGAATALRPLLGGLVALALAIGMAAILYLPVQEYGRHSIRGATQSGGTDYDYATSWSLHPAEWSTFLFPASWGFGEDTYFGRMPMTNYPNYFGVLPFLVALSLFLLKPRRPFDLFFGGLLLFATGVAAGRFLPLIYRPLYDWLPWFDKFRVPVMILVLQQFALAVLFARGLEATCATLQGEGVLRKVLLAGLVLTLLVALIGPGMIAPVAVEKMAERIRMQLAQYPPEQVQAYLNGMAEQFRGLADQIGGWLRGDSLRAGLLLLAPLAILELRRRRAAADDRPRRKQDRQRSRAPGWLAALPALFVASLALNLIVDFLPLDQKLLDPAHHWRSRQGIHLWGLPRRAERELPSRSLGLLKEHLGHQRFYALSGSRFASNEAAAAGLANLGGYHAAKLAWADSVVRALPSREQELSGGRGAQLLDRFAVKYLLAPQRFDLGADYPAVAQAEEVIYGNAGARDRLFLSESVTVEPAAASRRRLIEGRGEGDRVYLDRDPGLRLAPGAAAVGRIAAVDWGLDQVSCEVHLDRSAVLVLADMNYPGWRVTVDGGDRELLTADGFFRAVALEAGDWAVQFLFEPPRLAGLLWLRRASFLLSLVLLALGLWRPGSRHGAAPGGAGSPTQGPGPGEAAA